MKKSLLIIFLFFSISINCFPQTIFVGDHIRIFKGQKWNKIHYALYYCGMVNEKVFSLAYKTSAYGTENYYYPITIKSISFRGMKFNITTITSDYITIEYQKQRR